jgi:hypothetical protein
MIPLWLIPKSGFIWKAVGVAAVLLAVYLGYRWFVGVINENAQLKIENSKLYSQVENERASHEETKRVFSTWRTGINDQLETERVARQELLAQYDRERERANGLSKMLAEHDFEHLASKKPKLIERRVNSATRRVFDDIEALTRDFATGGSQAPPTP